MRRSHRRLGAVLLGAALVLAAVAPAAAQPDDDWDVRRDPFDKAVVAKLKGILARSPNDADALAKLLGLYRRYRTVQLLRDEYEAALVKKPGDWATLVVLARLARTSGDDAAALGFFEKAAAAKDDPAVALELGTLYRAAGKATEARAALDKALAGSKPVKMKALRALADLALTAKDIDGAKGYFEQYIALDPGNAQLRLELGDALAQAGKHDDAIAVYVDAEKKLGRDPARRVEVVARIGQAQEGKGDDQAAIESYRRAIRLVPRGYYLEVELTARIVDIHRRKQSLPELVGYYEKEWPEGRRGHFEWNTLARLYEETGDQDKAVAAFKRAVAKAPYELETQRRLIQLLEALGRDKEAIAQYEVVAREAPGEARFQIELAERYMRAGDDKKALDAVKKLESRFPGDAGVQSAIADMYTRWGKEDQALAAFERLARLEPDEPAHLVTLGEQYHQRGQKDKAMATWKRIANTRTAAAYAKLGDVLAEHDAPAEGLVYYAKALKLEPQNPDLYRGRAQIHERQKGFADAVADWEKALSLWTKPSDRTARREARRRIVNLLPRWDGGRKETEYVERWKRAFARAQPDLEAGYYLVEYYGRRPQAGQPRATLERILEITPDDQDSMQDLVKVYRQLREFDKAVALLLELAKKNPAREREVFSQIAEIKTEAGRGDEAIEWAQRALQKSPNDPVAYERLAERYEDLKQFDDAAAAYQRVIELDPRNFKAYFALAALHSFADRRRPAIDLYLRILRQSTDEAQLVQAAGKAFILEEFEGTLGELEKVLAPLSTILSHKPVYRRILVSLYDRYVPALVARTRHGAPEVRAAARAELDRLGKGGMKALLDALADDKDPVQRAVAVRVLGYLGNKAAAVPLVRVAKEEAPAVDPSAPRQIGTLNHTLELPARVSALVAAGRLGEPRVVGEVLPLAKHSEVALREAAVFALAHTRDARVAGALTDALADRRPSVAALACLGLGAIDDGRARALLVKTLADARTHDLVRAACAAGAAEHGASAVPALITALGDNAGETQRVAAWTLGHLGDRRALPALYGAYFRRVGQDRATLEWAIARVAGAPAAPLPDLTLYPMSASGKLDLPALIRQIPGPLPAAVIPAGAIVGHEAEIAAAIEASLGSHRDEALSVLADLDSRDAGLGLGALTAGEVSPAAARALDAIGAAILPSVAARAKDDDVKVAERAVAVAGKIGGAPAAAAIDSGLAAKSRLVRTTAIHAIAVLERRGGAPPALRAALLARLTGADWEDRRAAAETLGELGAKATAAEVTALAAATRDREAYVRDAAVVALGRLKAPAGLDALLAASRDDNWWVRASAATALRGFADGRASARVVELAKDDPWPAVRAAASGQPLPAAPAP